jgi:hypothetical protein
VCVCRGVVFCFLLLDGKMVDFGDCSHTVLAFFAPGKSVNEALSSWKTDVQLWIEKKESLFGDFGTSIMILQ